MKIHEHLIQINALGDASTGRLTRAQLWAGLTLRAEDPAQFIAHLESALILERREADGRIELERELDFGGFTVRDSIRLTPDSECLTVVAGTERWPSSSFLIRIEEPAPGELFLRFIYESNEPEPHSDEDRMGLKLRRQAYEQADMETARRIRELAEAGELDD